MDDDMMKKAQNHEIGASLERLSIDELEGLLRALDAEKTRVEQEIAKKDSSREAANSVFNM